jgi:flagellar biosynthesis/type III secretory pathway M-ring protein FliF/YscJ
LIKQEKEVMMINKKAQAGIITTVLIILLVLAAVVIIWQVIFPLISKGGEEITQTASCLSLHLEITEATPGGVKVHRKKGGDEVPVAKIRVFVNDEERDVTSPEDQSLEVLQTKTYVVADIAEGNRIKIAPVLADGTRCDFADDALAVPAGV